MKEKIGIEKLIELLNEYEGKPSWYELRGSIWFELDEVPYDDYIITKKFGFIKWLVENDKIDNQKIADETYVKVDGEWYELILGCHYDLYQQTLMLLAIQDEPIRFLCEILK